MYSIQVPTDTDAFGVEGGDLGSYDLDGGDDDDDDVKVSDGYCAAATVRYNKHGQPISDDDEDDREEEEEKRVKKAPVSVSA